MCLILLENLMDSYKTILIDSFEDFLVEQARQFQNIPNFRIDSFRFFGHIFTPEPWCAWNQPAPCSSVNSISVKFSISNMTQARSPVLEISRQVCTDNSTTCFPRCHQHIETSCSTEKAPELLPLNCYMTSIFNSPIKGRA